MERTLLGTLVKYKEDSYCFGYSVYHENQEIQILEFDNQTFCKTNFKSVEPH